MKIETLTVRNFRCFGQEPETFSPDTGVTAMVGGNGAGKTAALQALARIFGVSLSSGRSRHAISVCGPAKQNSSPEPRGPSNAFCRSPSWTVSMKTPRPMPCRIASIIWRRPAQARRSRRAFACRRPGRMTARRTEQPTRTFAGSAREIPLPGRQSFTLCR